MYKIHVHFLFHTMCLGLHLAAQLKNMKGWIQQTMTATLFMG